jgi:hypothetical protein
MAAAAAAVLLGLALLAQSQPDPDQYPLAMHRNMELDDLDHEIQRIHDTVLMKRYQLASTQRLAQRGGVSRNELERESVSLKLEEAREVESRAYRDLKLYERDVSGKAVPRDEQKEYSLVLNWVKAQEGIGQIDLDYKGYLLKNAQSLYARKLISRQELEDAEQIYDMASAKVVLYQSREAQVLMELAARKGEKKYDTGEFDRLKSNYFRARLRFYEMAAAAAHRRYDIASERSRRGLIPPNELPLFQKSVDDADAALEAERKRLETSASTLAPPATPPGPNTPTTPAPAPTPTP